MDAPVKELEQLEALHKKARDFIEKKAFEEADLLLKEALQIEANNPRTLDLMAKSALGKGDEDKAGQLKAQADMLRKEAWQKQVEAEIRGHHEVMGEAVRKETL